MQKILWAIFIGCILFFGVSAYVLSNRLTQSDVSLISGAVIGVLVSSPAAATIGALLMHRYMSDKVVNQSTSYHFRAAPMVDTAPQYNQIPQYQVYPAQSQIPFAQMLPQLPARRHLVVGDDGETREL